MPRLFEIKRSEAGEDVTILIDLDKVCAVVVEKPSRHHFETIKIRFVDGHEATDIVPPELAREFLDAFRQYLSG